MSRNPKFLTLNHAQHHQPWTVPYSDGVVYAASGDVAHIMATHDTLHAMKTVGKLAAVFESLDHSGNPDPDAEQLQTIKDMSADLISAALRLGNLYRFNVDAEYVRRVEDKNSISIQEWPDAQDARDLAGASVSMMNQMSMSKTHVPFPTEQVGAHPVSECEERGCNCGSLSGIPDVARRAVRAFAPSSMTSRLPPATQAQMADDRIRDMREGVKIPLSNEQRSAMLEGCGAFDPNEKARGFPGWQSPEDFLDKNTGAFKVEGTLITPPPDDDQLVAGDEHTAYDAGPERMVPRYTSRNRSFLDLKPLPETTPTEDTHPIQSGRTDRT